MNRHPMDSDDAGRTALEQRAAAVPWRPLPAGWRAQILGPTQPAARSWSWRDLFWPSPWAWGTVATAWIAAVLLWESAEQTALRGATLAGRATTPAAITLAGWRQQQELLSALLKEDSPVETRPAVLRPRSQLPGPRLGRRPQPERAAEIA